MALGHGFFERIDKTSAKRRKPEPEFSTLEVAVCMLHDHVDIKQIGLT